MADNDQEKTDSDGGSPTRDTANNNTLEIKVESMTNNNLNHHNASINGGSHIITSSSSSSSGNKKKSSSNSTIITTSKKNSLANDTQLIMDFDQFLPYVGDCGRYQALIFIVMIPFCFFFAFVYFAQMFITLVPNKYYCNVPELELFNLTEEQRWAFLYLILPQK